MTENDKKAILKYINGHLNADERKEVRKNLREDPDYRLEYEQMLRLHGATINSIVSLGGSETGQKKSVIIRPLVVRIAATLLILVGISGYLFRINSPDYLMKEYTEIGTSKGITSKLPDIANPQQLIIYTADCINKKEYKKVLDLDSALLNLPSDYAPLGMVYLSYAAYKMGDLEMLSYLKKVYNKNPSLYIAGDEKKRKLLHKFLKILTDPVQSF